MTLDDRRTNISVLSAGAIGGEAMAHEVREVGISVRGIHKLPGSRAGCLVPDRDAKAVLEGLTRMLGGPPRRLRLSVRTAALERDHVTAIDAVRGQTLVVPADRQDARGS